MQRFEIHGIQDGSEVEDRMFQTQENAILHVSQDDMALPAQIVPIQFLRKGTQP